MIHIFFQFFGTSSRMSALVTFNKKEKKTKKNMNDVMSGYLTAHPRCP